MTQIRVLLVDDVAAIREMLRFALEIDGRFEIVGEAVDVPGAEEAAVATSPDVVVLDLDLAGSPGHSAIPLLQAASPSSAIVVLSGSSSIPEASTLGVASVLRKNISMSEIVAALVEVGPQDASSMDSA